MELLFDVSLFSIVLSASTGIVVALLIIRKWQFPKNTVFFITTLILNIFSPFIGQSTYIFGISDQLIVKESSWEFMSHFEGSITGINLSFFLFSFFLVVNIMYLLRQFNMKSAKLSS